VTHLTIIAHSQGTMIAVDVLTLTGLDPTSKDEISGWLKKLKGFHLITMGSPLSHLYQHYFPGRYAPFTDPSWNDLKAQIRNWINIYRIDDYVGTHIQNDPRDWPDGPRNFPISPGGHTGYWELREIFMHPEVRKALPGT
jgi:hypothetical protein